MTISVSSSSVARAVRLHAIGEAYAVEHALAWRSISVDAARRSVTIYGPRFDVLAVVGEIA